MRHTLLAPALLAALLAPAASAHHGEGVHAERAQHAELRAGDVVITAPWTRAAGQGQNGAGYLTLRNTGSTPDRLLAAESPAARVVELHTHIRDGEVMRMRPVNAIALPPGQAVRLEPGGLHLMLIGLTRPLLRGESVPVTLRFERAGSIELRLSVEAAGARAPAHHH
jgi:periplasmic copper chaperone A